MIGLSGSGILKRQPGKARYTTRFGTVLYGTVGNGIITLYAKAWGMALYEAVRCERVRNLSLRYGTVRNGTVRIAAKPYAPEMSETVRYETVCYCILHGTVLRETARYCTKRRYDTLRLAPKSYETVRYGTKCFGSKCSVRYGMKGY